MVKGGGMFGTKGSMKNPADKYRKAQREREKKKNKFERKRQREDSRLKSDPDGIRREIIQIKRQIQAAIPDPKVVERLHMLENLLAEVKQIQKVEHNSTLLEQGKVVADDFIVNSSYAKERMRRRKNELSAPTKPLRPDYLIGDDEESTSSSEDEDEDEDEDEKYDEPELLNEDNLKEIEKKQKIAENTNIRKEQSIEEIAAEKALLAKKVINEVESKLLQQKTTKFTSQPSPPPPSPPPPPPLPHRVDPFEAVLRPPTAAPVSSLPVQPAFSSGIPPPPAMQPRSAWPVTLPTQASFHQMGLAALGAAHVSVHSPPSSTSFQETPNSANPKANGPSNSYAHAYRPSLPQPYERLNDPLQIPLRTDTTLGPKKTAPTRFIPTTLRMQNKQTPSKRTQPQSASVHAVAGLSATASSTSSETPPPAKKITAKQLFEQQKSPSKDIDQAFDAFLKEVDGIQ